MTIFSGSAHPEPRQAAADDVAPALAEAMRRMHDGESVSVLFDHTAAELAGPDR